MCARPRACALYMRTPHAADHKSASAGFAAFSAGAGRSEWKEGYFSGGFPGGEVGLLKWIEDGMVGDVPDVPQGLQPRSEVARRENVNEETMCSPWLGYCWTVEWEAEEEPKMRDAKPA